MVKGLDVPTSESHVQAQASGSGTHSPQAIDQRISTAGCTDIGLERGYIGLLGYIGQRGICIGLYMGTFWFQCLRLGASLKMPWVFIGITVVLVRD